MSCHQIFGCRIFTLLALVVLAAFPARAQAPDIATAEQVAIAFYKTAGLTPGFSAWAQDTDLYHHTPIARRDSVAAQEAVRLQQAYAQFSPEKDLLNVATTAVVSLSEEPDPENITRPLYFVRWHLNSENADFFPYEHRDMVFVLAPHGIQEFQQGEVTAEQYAYIKERMGNNRNVRILLHMRAQQADASAPVEIFGEEVWVLRTLMAGATLWDAEGGLLWEKSAGWYVSPQTHSLNELKQDQGAGDE